MKSILLMKTPTKVEKARLVQALASYILSDGARIDRQQRAYARYMSVFETLEAKYPHIAFRSDATTSSLTQAAKTLASRKVFRGPGATS